MSMSEKLFSYLGGHTTITTTLLVCALVQMIYEMDQTIISANAKALSDYFNVTVTAIGVLFFTRACVQVLCQPLWGSWSDIYHRKYLLMTGAFVWGTTTMCMGLASNWYVLLFLRGTAGIGLAAILPIIHHLVSDSFVSAKRGQIFGVLGACQMFGGIVSILFATNASVVPILGMAGWRFTFGTTGLFGVMVGVVSFYGLQGSQLLRGLGDKSNGTQPHVVELLIRRERIDAQQDDAERAAAATAAAAAGSIAGTSFSCSRLCRNTVTLFGNRTYLLLFLRAALDGIPMNANALLLLWFEYMGFAESHASGLIALLLCCNGISSLFFGWLGDYMHVQRPETGRLFVALGALVLQMVFTLWLFSGIHIHPEDNGEGNPMELDEIMMDYFPTYAMIVVGMGLFGDADQQCCDLPLLADVVPTKMRGFAYSLVDMVQCFFAFLATIIVGLLSEKSFGFVYDANRPINEWDADMRATNTKALGSALLTVNMFAMSGSFVLYVLLLFSYPGDAKWMKDQESKKYEEDGGDGGGPGDVSISLLSEESTTKVDL